MTHEINYPLFFLSLKQLSGLWHHDISYKDVHRDPVLLDICALYIFISNIKKDYSSKTKNLLLTIIYKNENHDLL